VIRNPACRWHSGALRRRRPAPGLLFARGRRPGNFAAVSHRITGDIVHHSTGGVAVTGVWHWSRRAACDRARRRGGTARLRANGAKRRMRKRKGARDRIRQRAAGREAARP
jgi:hypothetical protein